MNLFVLYKYINADGIYVYEVSTRDEYMWSHIKLDRNHCARTVANSDDGGMLDIVCKELNRLATALQEG
jgi:hypothetical protein